MSSKLFVVLPSFNESRGLACLIPAINNLKTDISLVVVDDASVDNTFITVEDMRMECNWLEIVYIKHSHNSGLGATLKTAFNYIFSICKDEDLIITMDSDNTHDPEYIPLMLEKIKDCDIVLGSRFAGNGCQYGMSYIRKYGSRYFNLLLSLILKKSELRDFTSGFRLYRASIIKKYMDLYGNLPFKHDGFAANGEIIINLLYFGARIKEVAIRLDYSLKESPSKFSVLPVLLEYLKIIYSRFKNEKQGK